MRLAAQRAAPTRRARSWENLKMSAVFKKLNLGEHTRQILASVGIDDAEYEQLRATGVI